MAIEAHGWLVGRVTNTQRLAETPDAQLEREKEIRELAGRHGLDPADLLQAIAVTQTAGGQHRLHFSRLTRSAEGRPRLDIARDVVASEPVFFAVEPDGWPAWLAGMNVPPRCD